MYLCEVAIVSRLCIFIYYMGLCEDYLTCDIAFDALMPLSRASTRRRYSRIEGVTICHSEVGDMTPITYSSSSAGVGLDDLFRVAEAYITQMTNPRIARD